MNHSAGPTATPVIPDHQLLRLIGEGGYGEVWLARNVVGTYRAVKIVYRKKFAEAAPYDREFKGIQKFEPISRSHPGLMDILQIGRNDDAGYFYYVMELADDEVSGRDLHPDTYSAKTLGKEMAARGRLSAGESLRIGIGLAEALGHMHKQDLVHRDIKPSNIIFVQSQPKLADIGLVVSVTDARSFVGTEGFIPPEGPGAVRADIYSLGKVLYEISTGQDRQSFPELPDELGEFEDYDLVMELNEVVVKACANSPQDRYATAEDLKSDLEMLLAGRSVKRLHFVERQLARVRRIALGAAVLAVAAVAFGYTVNRLHQRERRLLAASYVTAGARLVEDGNLHGALPSFAGALRLEEKDPAAAETHRLRIGAAFQQSPRLLQFWQHGGVVSDLRFSADGTRLLVGGEQKTRIVNLQSGAVERTIETTRKIETAAFSPDGRHIAIANGSYVTLVEAASGTVEWESKGHGNVYSAEFSPDGETVVIGCYGGCADLLDARSGVMMGDPVKRHKGGVSYASFSPDGLCVLTAGRDGTVGLLNLKTRAFRQGVRLSEHWIQDASFSPDGKHFVTARVDHTVRVWDVVTGLESAWRMEHRAMVRRARFSPDGRLIVSAGFDNVVRFWDAHTGRNVGATINLGSLPMHAVFSPEGRRVATAEYGGGVKIWDIAPDGPVDIGRAIISSDGERYITFSTNSFRVWNAHDDSPLTPLLNCTGSVTSVLASATADIIATVAAAGTNRLSMVEIHQPGKGLTGSFNIPKPTTNWLSPNGQLFLTSTGRSASVWETVSGKHLFERTGFPHRIRAAAFAPNAEKLLLASEKEVFAINARTGTQLFPPLPHAMDIEDITFSPDGTKFVTFTSSTDFNPAVARLWDAEKGRSLGPEMSHRDGIVAARFSHDGRSVATACEGNDAGVWDVGTGQRRIAPISMLWQVRSVDWSANDRWLLATTWYETQIWDPSTGQSITPVIPAPDLFTAGGFCAGSRRIWVRTRRNTLLFDLPRSAETPDEIIARAHQLGVTVPDGTRLENDAGAKEQLRRYCDANLKRWQSGLGAWHRVQAAAGELKQDWFAAQFHLEQSLKLSPDDAELRTRLDAAQSQLRASTSDKPTL